MDAHRTEPWDHAPVRRNRLTLVFQGFDQAVPQEWR